MRTLARLYGWTTANPVGAFVVTSLVLTVCFLGIACAAGFTVNFGRVLTTFEVSAVGGVFAAAHVWAKTSPNVAMIKPPWMSWMGFFGLVAQVLIAFLILYAEIAHALGHWDFPRDVDLAFHQRMIPFSMAAVVTAVALYRNQWWAFFLELVLLWTIILWAYFDPTPSTVSVHHRTPSFDIPYQHEFNAVLEWVMFISFNWWMIKRGFQRFHEQRAVVAGL